jgi:hypothetical protein
LLLKVNYKEEEEKKKKRKKKKKKKKKKTWTICSPCVKALINGLFSYWILKKGKRINYIISHYVVIFFISIFFFLPSTGFEPTPLIHCSTIRLALRPAP